jgi:hypothetical protein
MEKLKTNMESEVAGCLSNIATLTLTQIKSHKKILENTKKKIDSSVGEDEHMLERFLNVLATYQDVNRKVFHDLFTGNGSKWTDIVRQTVGTEPKCPSPLQLPRLAKISQTLFSSPASSKCCIECHGGRQSKEYMDYVKNSFITKPSEPEISMVTWVLCSFHEQLFPMHGRRYFFQDYLSDHVTVGYQRSLVFPYSSD